MSKKFAVVSLAFFSLLLFGTQLLAQCAVPSTEGTMQICFPSNGSSIIGETTFSLSANTGSAAITKVVLYDNGNKVDSFGFLPGTLVEGAIHDGYHRVTIHAWDTTGHMYAGTTSFTKIGGFDPGPCAPSTTGVTMCSPKSGALEPAISVPVSFAFKPSATPTAWKMYLDGTAILHSDSSTLKSIVTPMTTSAGSHRLTVVGWDSAGQVYKTSHDFTAFYAYDCDPNTGNCTPGIKADAPSGFGPYEAVAAPPQFQFHAEVVNNPAPIQKMSVTLDGVVIAQNSGPGVSVTINAKPGSHVIIVQAMDTQSKLYATYGTVDVQ